MSKYFWNEVMDYLWITIGLLVYAAGITYFLLPYELTTGGVTGVSSIIYYATGFEVQYSYLIINIFLLIMGVRILGWKFCIKTIFAVLMLTLELWILQRMAEDPTTHELPKVCGDQLFMACLIGAGFEGTGLALAFLHNGSTGGTDIIAAIVNKYRNMSLGQMLLICDVIIISSCYFVFHDWQKIVFGFVCLVTSSVTLDYIVNRVRQSVQFMIYSRNYKKIADAILANTGHTVTVLDGTGWYTKTSRKVIVMLAKKRESIDIMRLIKNIDPYAFVSVANVTGVYGEGFDSMKIKNKKMKPTIVFASNNEHKLEEVRAILGSKFEVRSLSDIGCDTNIPETGTTFKENALQKAEYIKSYYGYDCFADDSGLECNALGGEPGVYSARYAAISGAGRAHDSEANIEALLDNLEDKEDRSAQFKTVIALVYQDKTYFFDGEVKGHITKEKRGNDGFGYDPIFVPDGYDQTFAEMGSEIKNHISHRAIAVEKLSKFLLN